MNFYAGIGPRDCLPAATARMTEIAHCRRGQGWWLRSGHSGKADLAFERGAHSSAHIFTPWREFLEDPRTRGPEPAYGAVVYEEPTPPAFKMAAAYHPAWDRCGRDARALLARNCHIILGPDLTDPVQDVVTWTTDGTIDGIGKQGGTAHALRVAVAHGVKVYNLRRPEHRDALERLLWVADEPLSP